VRTLAYIPVEKREGGARAGGFTPERQIEHASVVSRAEIKRRIKYVEQLRRALD
jgi:hypothetical protein